MPHPLWVEIEKGVQFWLKYFDVLVFVLFLVAERLVEYLSQNCEDDILEKHLVKTLCTRRRIKNCTHINKQGC